MKSIEAFLILNDDYDELLDSCILFQDIGKIGRHWGFGQVKKGWDGVSGFTYCTMEERTKIDTVDHEFDVLEELQVIRSVLPEVYYYPAKGKDKHKVQKTTLIFPDEVKAKIKLAKRQLEKFASGGGKTKGLCTH